MDTPGSPQSGPFLKSYHIIVNNKLASLHGLVYTRTTARSRPQDSEICRNYELHDGTFRFCMVYTYNALGVHVSVSMDGTTLV